MGAESGNWHSELTYDQWVALSVSGPRPLARYKVMVTPMINLSYLMLFQNLCPFSVFPPIGCYDPYKLIASICFETSVNPIIIVLFFGLFKATFSFSFNNVSFLNLAVIYTQVTYCGVCIF